MSKNNRDNIRFNGGIQIGTTAYDFNSKKLNVLLTKAKKELSKELLPFGIYMKSGLTASETPGGLVGLNPDGGIWFSEINGIKTVIVFEGKKQGERGNAHERWWKNHTFIKHMFSDIEIRYVTFCVGKGVLPTSTLYKAFSTVLAFEKKDPKSWNICHPQGVSFFSSENGFDLEEIKGIMRKAIFGDFK